jgi:AcrR family transcriptional regulator
MPRTSRRATPSPRDGYHHGDLHAQLIEASEALLAERGLEGFSLREVARRSGVSPAAPAHHFGDVDGLLSAVATLAFDGLTEALEAGNLRGGDSPVARLREQGVGYVDFALRYPGRFGLMFRSGLRKSEALKSSADHAFSALERGVREMLSIAPEAPMTPGQWQVLLAVWSVVHGFAHLALAGQFDAIAPARGRASLLREVVAPMLERQLDGLRLGSAEREKAEKGRAPMRRRAKTDVPK